MDQDGGKGALIVVGTGPSYHARDPTPIRTDEGALTVQWAWDPQLPDSCPIPGAGVAMSYYARGPDRQCNGNRIDATRLES